MRSATQRPLTRLHRAACRLRKLICVLCALLWIGTAGAQPQELTREIYPPATEKGPAVVVVSGIGGTASFRKFSAKLAKAGYYVILMDGRDVLILPGDTRGLDGAVNLRRVIKEAQSAEKAVPGKVALVGFSLGGGGVLLHGTPLQDQVAAVVAYYPAITHLGPDLQPLAARMQTPVLVLAGEQDRYRDCCLLESMRALAAAPKSAPFDLVVYPKANHGFNLAIPEVYRAEDAADAWQRTTDFLKQHLPLRSR